MNKISLNTIFCSYIPMKQCLFLIKSFILGVQLYIEWVNSKSVWFFSGKQDLSWTWNQFKFQNGTKDTGRIMYRHLVCFVQRCSECLCTHICVWETLLLKIHSCKIRCCYPFRPINHQAFWESVPELNIKEMWVFSALSIKCGLTWAETTASVSFGRSGLWYFSAQWRETAQLEHRI